MMMMHTVSTVFCLQNIVALYGFTKTVKEPIFVKSSYTPSWITLCKQCRQCKWNEVKNIDDKPLTDHCLINYVMIEVNYCSVMYCTVMEGRNIDMRLAIFNDLIHDVFYRHDKSVQAKACVVYF